MHAVYSQTFGGNGHGLTSSSAHEHVAHLYHSATLYVITPHRPYMCKATIDISGTHTNLESELLSFLYELAW